jgi:hypothetical protein
MKKLILSVTAMAACSVGAYAQGTIAFDGSNNSNPSPSATSDGYIFINGAVDTGTDVNAELLYSVSGTAGTFLPLVTLSLAASGVGPSGPAAGQTIDAAGDITTIGTGQIYDLSGTAYNVPGSTTSAFFQVLAWLGGNSYATATQAGASAVWQNTTLGLQGSPVTTDIQGMSAVNLVPTTVVPEPSTLAMAGVGLASMLFLRRKTK